MNIAGSIIAALAATTGTNPSAAPAHDEIVVQRFGLYVLADDIERAATFYEALFGAPPQVRTPVLIGFNVAGGLFGIVPRRLGPPVPAGGSVRPYLRVADLEAAFARARRLAPDRIEAAGIVVEGNFRFFRLTDPEGNVLEFFAVQTDPDRLP